MTKEEKENEAKRWTTFLQKPDRPIPVSKEQLEQERRKALGYRIKMNIPSKALQDQLSDKKENELSTSVETVDEPEKSTEMESACSDGIHCGTPPSEGDAVVSDEPTAAASSTDDVADDAENIDSETNEPAESIIDTQSSTSVETVVRTAEELLVERKLSDIQQQLAALSALPITIQATLDAVSKQLSELLPSTIKSKQISTECLLSENDASKEGTGRQL